MVAIHTVLLHPLLQRGGEGLARHQRLGQAGQGNALGLGFFQDQLQKAGRANVARRAQLGHGLHLLLGLARATGKHRAAHRMGAVFHHRPSRDKVVAEAVVDQLARAKACGVNGARHAPVVAAQAFGLVDRAGAGEHARHGLAKTLGGKAAKGPLGTQGLLALKELVFARDGQLRQCRARGDARCIHPGQDVGKRRAVGLGVGNLLGQGGQQGGFALLGSTGFQGVVEQAHAVVSFMGWEGVV